jgi:integrase
MMTPLKIHSPDQSESPATPISASPPPMLTLSTVQLAEFAASIVQQMQLQSAPPTQQANASVLTHVESPKSSSDDPRLSQPGVILTLRDCFNSDLARNSARREPETWADYLSTVESLESAWGGAGPDVRTLTPALLQAAFASIPEWKSRSTWIKRRKYLVGMLRSCTRQTTRNPHGIPKSEPALLSEDDLPIWELPAEKWFLSRGHVESPHLPALTVAEFDKILTACETSSDPTWWKTLLSFWWFCAMRRDDTLLKLHWYSPALRTGVDLSRQWLTYRAAKPPHETFDIPLPDWLCVGLRALVGRHESKVFWRPTGASKLSRWLYPTLKEICKRAGIEYRDPTAFRQSCSTHWDDHDPQLANRFTAHKESSVLKTHYIHHNESQLRAAADRHPKPSVPLATFEVARAILPIDPTDTNRTIDTATNSVS